MDQGRARNIAGHDSNQGRAWTREQDRSESKIKVGHGARKGAGQPS